MKIINKMVVDDRTYIESVGKRDRETVYEALSEKGTDTALRVCIGVTGKKMPRRALSYFASALAVRNHYFPEAELQFVYPLQSAVNVNGVDQEQGNQHTRELDQVARTSFGLSSREGNTSVTCVESYYDTHLPSKELQTAVSEVLAGKPDLSTRFRSAAKEGERDYVTYVAAHILMHDTNPELLSLEGDRSVKGTAKRVISLGAQSEIPFYLARMACQQAKILPGDQQIATGQLFTRQVIAPYLSCREGEPLLGSGFSAASHPIASVQRDLEYLDRALLLAEIENSNTGFSVFVRETV